MRQVAFEIHYNIFGFLIFGLLSFDITYHSSGTRGFDKNNNNNNM
jgi:hypothetical protein